VLKDASETGGADNHWRSAVWTHAFGGHCCIAAA
jgi:hypothetical protein